MWRLNTVKIKAVKFPELPLWLSCQEVTRTGLTDP